MAMRYDEADRYERVASSGLPELTLVAALEAQAKRDGLSGRALMESCGLDHTLWIRVKRGSRRFSPEACAKIVRRYPRMRAATVRYLAQSYDRPTLRLLGYASRLAGSQRLPDPSAACR